MVEGFDGDLKVYGFKFWDIFRPIGRFGAEKTVHSIQEAREHWHLVSARGRGHQAFWHGPLVLAMRPDFTSALKRARQARV